MAKDHFSTVFGERRGSQAAQDERDREETEDLIRRTLAPEHPLFLPNLVPVMDFFSSDDPEIRAILADSVVANYRQNTMEALAITLGSEEITPEARVFLRALAVEYFTRDRSASATPERKRTEAAFFLKSYFNSAPVRSSEELREDLPLIRALARIYRGNGVGASCFPLLDCLLLLRDNENLNLFKPWAKAVSQEVKDGHCDARLDDFQRMLHHREDEDSPLRRKILAPLREAVSAAQSRVLELNMKTLLQNGD